MAPQGLPVQDSDLNLGSLSPVSSLLQDDPYRLMIDSVSDYSLFMLDPQGLIVTWNLGAERLKGYLASEVIGRHFSVFYDAEAIKNKIPQGELVVAATAGRYEAEGWRLRKDGSSFWAHVVITALRRPDGALAGFGKITQDLVQAIS